MPSIDLYVNYGVYGVRDCSRPAMAMDGIQYLREVRGRPPPVERRPTNGRPGSAAARFDIHHSGRPITALACLYSLYRARRVPLFTADHRGLPRTPPVSTS